MTNKLNTLSVFAWCAAFAAASSLFQTLLEIFSEKNDSKRFSKRDAIRVLVSVSSVGFYGGLAGWAVAHVFPDARGELLGIVAAVLGSGGPKVTRLFLTGVVEKTLNIKVVNDSTAK